MLKLTLKFEQFYRQFETFVPLKSLLSHHFMLPRSPLEESNICNIILEHEFDPLQNIKKNLHHWLGWASLREAILC